MLCSSFSWPEEPMPLQDGPIIFLTDADRESLAALPDVHGLATALGCRLSIVHVLGGTGESRLAAAVAALPGDPPGVLAVPAADLQAALAELAGVLALLAHRHGPVMRL